MPKLIVFQCDKCGVRKESTSPLLPYNWVVCTITDRNDEIKGDLDSGVTWMWCEGCWRAIKEKLPRPAEVKRA